MMKIIKEETLVHERNDERVKIMRELRAEGWTLHRIGVEFSVSRQRVKQLLSPKTLTLYTELCTECGHKETNSTLVRVCSVCLFKRKVGKADLAKIFKGKPEWKKKGRERIRELVRYRDKYTCQSCKRKWHMGERAFDVHHLNGLCGKRSRGYDKKEDMGGLITLCHKCHFNHPSHSQKKLLTP